MNQEETLALLKKGREAWNNWAEEILGRRRMLEAVGEWQEKATADFTEHCFEERVDFKGFRFPGNAQFNNATFKGHAQFNNATFKDFAWFESATFTGSASFESAKFKGHASFDNATFTGFTRFGNATFKDSAWFNSATFKDFAWFESATFKDSASFESAIFTGFALFGDATFTDSAWFDNATFKDSARFNSAIFTGSASFESAIFTGFALFGNATFTDSAWFDNATFKDSARFNSAIFTGSASFESARFRGYSLFTKAKFMAGASFAAARSEGAFTLADAKFKMVPDFGQAHFDEAPRLDNLHIKPERSGVLAFFKHAVKRLIWTLLRWRLLAKLPHADFKAWLTRIQAAWRPAPDEEGLPARWRSLKRLAVQGHDHERELEFFSNEIIARRGVDDKLHHAQLWTGFVYQALSDFGRSIIRPLLWLVLSTVCFAFSYLGEHMAVVAMDGDDAPPPCKAGSDNPLSEAFLLSLDKTLPLPEIVNDGDLDRIYACLYGYHDIDATKPQTKSTSPPPRVRIPSAVSWKGAAQVSISTVLIFLLLLALRNHFRIR